MVSQQESKACPSCRGSITHFTQSEEDRQDRREGVASLFFNGRETLDRKLTMKIQSTNTWASALGYMARRPASTPTLTRSWLETDTDSTRPDTCFDNCDSYKIDMTMRPAPLERYWNYLSIKYLYNENRLRMREIWPIYSGRLNLWRGNPNCVQIFLSSNSLDPN
jgi:hypothetical protein